jgi:putative alpha-1,2-mannosidase
LNTSRKQPYDWAGNEPALGIPWEYDYAGAPWRVCADGGNYECPWLAASVLTTGAQLHFTLSATPNKRWATAPAAAPPSMTPP